MLFQKPSQGMKNQTRWMVIVVVVLVLFPGTAALAQTCEDDCDASSECTQECLTFDGFYGHLISCGEYGVCEEGQPPVYDMVSWMKQTYSGAASTHLEQTSGGVISEFSGCTFGNTFYRSNSGSGEYHERFTYDSTWISILREVFDASSAHFKTHDNFHWLRRYMSPGTCFTADCSWREHVGSCSTPPETPCSTTVCLKGPYLLDVGGDIGTVETLVRTQLQGNGNEERYYYAKPYGMVMFKLLQPDGTVASSEVFNQIVPGEVTPNPSSCFEVGC